jgi:adenine-specific DNA-methyltransferase
VGGAVDRLLRFCGKGHLGGLARPERIAFDLLQQLVDVLTTEVARLRERKTFGLVFEKHIPEIAVVTGTPLREGMLARRRDRPDEQIDYEIEALTAKTATVRAVADDAEPEKVPRKLLAAVKEFGQPVYPGLKLR